MSVVFAVERTKSTRPCPNCRRFPPRFLAGVSRDAWVNYFRCDGCEHVWNVPKDDPQAEPRIVVQGQEPATAAC